MNWLDSIAISASGMNVEKLRADVAAYNIANAHATRSATGAVYQPLRVIATAGRFADYLDANRTSSATSAEAATATVTTLDLAPRMVYEPGHPDADTKGFVAYPPVDNLTEMVTLSSAIRSYEANVVAMNAAKSMALKALDIGGA